MEIDSLSIEISANAQKAEQQINKLASALGNLSKKLIFDTTGLQNLSKLNGDNFSKIGDGIKNFADGMKQLQSVKKADFNRLAAGIERLGKIDAGNMSTVSNALKPLADGINTLSNANFNNGNLQNFINSLTRLSNANVSNISANSLKGVGTAIKQLATDLSDAPKIQQSVISMTNAIASLARSGANIPTVTTSLGQLGSSLKRFMSDMSQTPMVASETIAFTQAIGTLASAGTKAQTTANGLAELGDNLKKLITSLSTAPKVSGNVVKLTSALATLANSGSKVGRASNSLKSGLDSISSSSLKSDLNIKKLTQSMNGLKNAMSKTAMGVKSFGQQLMAAMGIYVSVFGAIQGVKKSIDISSSLTEVQNVVDVTFGNMSSKVEEFTKNSIEQFGMSELSAKQFASRFQAMGTAMGINNKLISGANGFLNSQTDGYVGLSDSMADVSLNLTKLTADMASFYNVEQKDVAQDLESIFTGQTRPLRTYGLDLTQATLAEWAMKNGLDADIKSMSQAEKTMLRYQYVLANSKAAHNDFSRTQLTWANQTRILRQQIEQLGAVLGGTFINLLKPLVQALNKAMSSIIAFAQTVSNALGKIFGWKFEVQGGVASDLSAGEDAAGGIADDMGTAADNAKKLNKQLRAFDELKTINLKDSNKSGSGSGAGGAGANAGQGEWVKTDGMFKDYESNLDSLYKLGDYIGKTLTDTLNKIDWDSVYEGARNFGAGLASFLNGLISPELFGALGRTVAGSINTALHFLDSFGETFDWVNFGKSLAAGLNEFMYTLDWETALSAARNWGTGIAKALSSFISETDFYEVGATVANALNTAIAFELSFAKTFDFEGLGLKIAEAINGFFETFDFAGLADSLNTWVDGLTTTLKTAAKNIKWESVFSGLGDFFGNLEIDTVGIIVGALVIKKIAKTLIEVAVLNGIGTMISKKIAEAVATKLGLDETWAGAAKGIGPAISGAIKSMGGIGGLLTIDSATVFGAGTAAEIGTFIGTGIIGGIVAAFTGWHFGQWLNEWITGEKIELSFTEQMKGIFDSFADGSWSGALKLWADDIRTNLNALGKDINTWTEETFGEKFVYTFEDLAKDISDIWENDIKPLFSEETWSAMWDGVKSACDTKWGELKEWWDSSTFKVIWEEDIVPWFSEEQWSLLWDNIILSFNTKWNELKEWWNTSALVVWWEEDVSPWFETDDWSALWDNVKSAFETKWGEIKTWWNDTAISQWWKNDVEPNFTKKKWEDTMKGVKEAFESTWDAAISSIKGIWNKFATWLNEKLTWTIDPVVIMGQTVFSGATINLGKIPTFQTGGFPEDGLFMANHSELVGQFNNGKTAVANNEQITKGIAEAVYPAVYNAVSSAMRNNAGNNNPVIKVFVGDRELTDIAIDGINERYRTGGSPLLI